MRTIRGATTLVAAAIAVVVLLVAGPAGAVIGGTDDTDNVYENAGVLQLRVGSDWFDFCSGTLIGPDVVLTAAHCTDFLVEEGPDGFGPDDLRISFDPEGDAPYATVERIVVHPDWFTAPPGRGLNSKHSYLAPPAEDIALVFLDSDVTGVTPAPVADADYLAGLNLTRETFTVVGYGTDRFVTGGTVSNHPVVIVDGIRSFRDVSVITKHDVFPDRFLKITQSTCFGDSGGPLFHDGTVVAINVWTFSLRCSGPNFSYRLDSRAAATFLEANL